MTGSIIGSKATRAFCAASRKHERACARGAAPRSRMSSENPEGNHRANCHLNPCFQKTSEKEERGLDQNLMKHSRFKYFSGRKYAEEFLDGKVFFQTAAFFRDYEDAKAQQIIGDEYEGARLYRPSGGLDINNLTHNQSFMLNAGMECLTKAHEIYIFCMSLAFTDVLKKEFNAVACAEISDPRAFIRRWLNALPEKAKHEGKHVARRVGYYRPEDVPGNVWALPDLIITTKLKRFEYQNEYRLAYTTTDAFAFQNCTYQLVDRKARPSPKPEEQ